MENIKEIKLRDFVIGGDKLTILAGPCAIESREILDETAKGLKQITKELDINFVFKSSFDKANRSSITSFRGPGLEKGLEMLQEVKDKYDLPIVTDIHTPEQTFYLRLSTLRSHQVTEHCVLHQIQQDIRKIA